MATVYNDDRPQVVLNYLQELIQLGRKHGFILSHEDGHGGFLVEPRSRHDAAMEKWLGDAGYDNSFGAS